MKNNLHILLYCENDNDLIEQKQTGLFAIDLVRQGFEVSILINNCNKKSNLETIYKKIKVFYTSEPSFFSNMIGGFYKYNIKEVLKKAPSIDIVQVMSVNAKSVAIGKACKDLQIPCLAKVYHKAIREFRGLNSFMTHLLCKKLNNFTKVVVNAEYVISIAKEHGINNITLIYDGINLDRLKGVFNKTPIRRQLGLPERTTLITCSANINRVNKQFETLKAMMPLSKKRQLIFIGDIEDKMLFENLKREVDYLKVKDFVHFIHDKDDYSQYIKASDLFVLLGGIEDRTDTILHAQALGVPVILGPSPSSLFLTNANRCGLVMYDDNVLVEQALNRMINDNVFRQSRSVNAREFVIDIFNRDKMINDYIKLYNSL